MGGFGSGRRHWRLSVADCRALAIGELCDGGRRDSQPGGEIIWREPHDERIRGRLSYTLAHESDALGQPRLLLSYRYWPQGAGLSSVGQVELRAASASVPWPAARDTAAAGRCAASMHRQVPLSFSAASAMGSSTAALPGARRSATCGRPQDRC